MTSPSAAEKQRQNFKSLHSAALILSCEDRIGKRTRQALNQNPPNQISPL